MNNESQEDENFMSWAFGITGTKQGVIREVRKEVSYPDDGDQKQIEAAKALIISEVEGMPANVPGVRVYASGHDDRRSSRNLKIEVEPVYKLAFDDDQSDKQTEVIDEQSTEDSQR